MPRQQGVEFKTTNAPTANDYSKFHELRQLLDEQEQLKQQPTRERRNRQRQLEL
jgi:hypothetical protein